ncbi:plasma protease C1 inhibitor isoform X2 [Lampris incognitus]|nr:plasma protease C1 inhibitor isoform X2 [Lampris incognitus]
MNQGSMVYLPCHRPSFSQANTYAHWFKETGGGERRELTPVEVSKTGERLEWFYSDPSSNDQTITLKELGEMDAGIYYCESAKGERFNTITLIVDVAPTAPPHSCSGFTTAWEPCQEETSSISASILKESMTEFSMKLYSHISQLKSSANLLFSPISISGIFSNLLLGARGDTRRVIEAALCLPHDFHCVHSQMKRLKENLLASLKIASQIYYNPYMNLSKSFTNQSVEFYNAEAVMLQNSSEENTEMINSWVAKHTNNKITHLVDSVPSETQLILLNAVYFNGQWKTRFDSHVKRSQFTKLNGDLQTVPILYSSKYLVSMQYVPELKAQVARFPLTGETSLYILLPRTHLLPDLQMTEMHMTDATILQMVKLLKSAYTQRVEVTLPRLKLDVQTDMKTLLKKLDLSSLFEDANLCGLYAEDKVILNDARHKAFLRLTEDGVEASAATSISLYRTFNSFSALRPFVLLIWSDQADVPLFMGRVTEP